MAQLYAVLCEMKSNLLLHQMNNKPTGFQAGRNPSLLDLFLSNKPENIDGIETLNSNIANHKLVNLQFHTIELKVMPQLSSSPKEIGTVSIVTN